ncbi:patatin-like phospholipase family protein [Halocatena salina]|uniref:Patatin-like phospholipase family protein n=1 Tax=Halocatena salina TaxID=2934340 RepID=A0A8U0AB72_9EURY|nr:patatin-like phospholipase family protein [Halocatena salina]UPM45143.1 patatin-like phospholipase family protein [Halocatena salina]
MTPSTPTNVAIACQGGGSHTAFTAGVLKHVLREQGSDYRISALSGTSGGALCAFVAWYGLRTGTHEKAISSLDALWDAVAANTPPERLANTGLVWSSRLLEMGFPIVQLPPSRNIFSAIGQTVLRETIESFVDAEPLDELVFEHQPADSTHPLPPKILVSAVDVNDGSFSVFTDRLEPESPASDHPVDSCVIRPDYLTERPRPLTIDAVVASTAVPTLFEGVTMTESDGSTHSYWDGLFSQNPPLRNLLSGPESKAQKPDEIWLVRINPTHREGDFRTLEAIADRRNELAGNLSLHQELFFIDRVNQWLEAGAFTDDFGEQYKSVTVRQIELTDESLSPPRRLTPSTKLDRDPTLLTELMHAGEEHARDFLGRIYEC